jgi:hypothetical protein
VKSNEPRPLTDPELDDIVAMLGRAGISRAVRAIKSLRGERDAYRDQVNAANANDPAAMRAAIAQEKRA